MSRFYSKEEFQDQLEELMAEGMSYEQAYDQVRLNEMQDEEEHRELMKSRSRHHGFDDE